MTTHPSKSAMFGIAEQTIILAYLKKIANAASPDFDSYQCLLNIVKQFQEPSTVQIVSKWLNEQKKKNSGWSNIIELLLEQLNGPTPEAIAKRLLDIHQFLLEELSASEDNSKNSELLQRLLAQIDELYIITGLEDALNLLSTLRQHPKLSESAHQENINFTYRKILFQACQLYHTQQCKFNISDLKAKFPNEPELLLAEFRIALIDCPDNVLFELFTQAELRIVLDLKQFLKPLDLLEIIREHLFSSILTELEPKKTLALLYFNFYCRCEELKLAYHVIVELQSYLPEDAAILAHVVRITIDLLVKEQASVSAVDHLNEIAAILWKNHTAPSLREELGWQLSLEEKKILALLAYDSHFAKGELEEARQAIAYAQDIFFKDTAEYISLLKLEAKKNLDYLKGEKNWPDISCRLLEIAELLWDRKEQLYVQQLIENVLQIAQPLLSDNQFHKKLVVFYCNFLDKEKNYPALYQVLARYREIFPGIALDYYRFKEWPLSKKEEKIYQEKAKLFFAKPIPSKSTADKLQKFAASWSKSFDDIAKKIIQEIESGFPQTYSIVINAARFKRTYSKVFELLDKHASLLKKAEYTAYKQEVYLHPFKVLCGLATEGKYAKCSVEIMLNLFRSYFNLNLYDACCNAYAVAKKYLSGLVGESELMLSRFFKPVDFSNINEDELLSTTAYELLIKHHNKLNVRGNDLEGCMAVLLEKQHQANQDSVSYHFYYLYHEAIVCFLSKKYNEASKRLVELAAKSTEHDLRDIELLQCECTILQAPARNSNAVKKQIKNQLNVFLTGWYEHDFVNDVKCRSLHNMLIEKYSDVFSAEELKNLRKKIDEHYTAGFNSLVDAKKDDFLMKCFNSFSFGNAIKGYERLCSKSSSLLHEHFMLSFIKMIAATNLLILAEQYHGNLGTIAIATANIDKLQILPDKKQDVQCALTIMEKLRKAVAEPICFWLFGLSIGYCLTESFTTAAEYLQQFLTSYEKDKNFSMMISSQEVNQFKKKVQSMRRKAAVVDIIKKNLQISAENIAAEDIANDSAVWGAWLTSMPAMTLSGEALQFMLEYQAEHLFTRIERAVTGRNVSEQGGRTFLSIVDMSQQVDTLRIDERELAQIMEEANQLNLTYSEQNKTLKLVICLSYFLRKDYQTAYKKIDELVKSCGPKNSAQFLHYEDAKLLLEKSLGCFLAEMKKSGTQAQQPSQSLSKPLCNN